MSNVISFERYKNKRDGKEGDRVQEAFKSVSTQTDMDTDLATRIDRIKSSIERLDKLMIELKGFPK